MLWNLVYVHGLHVSTNTCTCRHRHDLISHFILDHLFRLHTSRETWLGWIPGFYTLVILAEAYLMLPMFGGADKVFRKVLVPLFGLQEILMVRDAFLVKKHLVKDLPPERAAVVRKTIANFFSEDEKHNNAESDLQSHFGFLKRTKKKEEQPTETSSLV